MFIRNSILHFRKEDSDAIAITDGEDCIVKQWISSARLVPAKMEVLANHLKETILASVLMGLREHIVNTTSTTVFQTLARMMVLAMMESMITAAIVRISLWGKFVTNLTTHATLMVANARMEANVKGK